MIGFVIIPIATDMQDDTLIYDGSTTMSRIAKRNDFIIHQGTIPVTTKTTMKGTRREGTNLQKSEHPSFSLRRYFIQWMFPELEWTNFQEKQKQSHTLLHNDRNNNKNNESETQNLQPQIAWLMSFPNSGTSYTLHLVHQVTNTSVGTNYEKEVKKDSSDIIAESVHSSSNKYFGPFVLQPHLKKPSSYILTKTHCSGYCNDCPIEKYIVDRYQFAQGCATNVLTPSSVNVLQQQDQLQQGVDEDEVKTSSNDRLTTNSSTNSTNSHNESSQIEVSKKKRNNEKKLPNMMQNNILYNYQIEPKRTIRLVRDPFSNIVSNFHHWIGKQTKQRSGLEKEYTDDFKGFQKYCQWYNLLFQKQLKQLIEFRSSNSGGGGVRGTGGGGGRKHLYSTNVWEVKRIFRRREMRELMKLVPCHQHFFRYVSVSFYFDSFTYKRCIIHFDPKSLLYGCFDDFAILINSGTTMPIMLQSIWIHLLYIIMITKLILLKQQIGY